MYDSCRFSIYANYFNFEHIFSTWALVRFPGPLLLAVYSHVLMEMRRFAQRVMGMDIDIGSHFPLTFSYSSLDPSNAMVRMKERKKLSTGKLVIFYA